MLKKLDMVLWIVVLALTAISVILESIFMIFIFNVPTQFFILATITSLFTMGLAIVKIFTGIYLIYSAGETDKKHKFHLHTSILAFCLAVTFLAAAFVRLVFSYSSIPD